MEEIGSRQYESIEALILAAEALERAELKAQEQKTVINDSIRFNSCIDNVEISTKSCNENQQNEDVTDGLLQTIDYIKELKATEHWNDILKKNKHKSDRILYRELSDLKKKLNKIKGITSKFSYAVPIIKEDEDTPTASEDEGYNKYNDVGNVDDITDDASECEETSKVPLKSRSNSYSKISEPRKMKVKKFRRSHKVSSMQYNVCRNANRKRQCCYFSSMSSNMRPSDNSMTLNRHYVNDRVYDPLSFSRVHSPPTTLKIHQAVVDI